MLNLQPTRHNMIDPIRPVFILVVDDDEVDRRVARRTMRSLFPGLVLHEASNLADAALRLNEQHFDCVILDRDLPDGDGLDSVARFQQLYADTAFVLWTGQGEGPDALRALRDGAEDYVQKEHAKRRLARAVAHAIERRGRVADIVRENRELSALVCRDVLTGLPNRRALEMQLATEVARLRRSDGVASAFIVDVDDFKRVNDQHGHAAGDRVLWRIAALLQEAVRSYDMVARVGGDEFVVLLPGADHALAAEIAERACRSIARDEMLASAVGRPVTVSIGVGGISPQMKRCADLFEATDKALHRSKTSGKNCVAI